MNSKSLLAIAVIAISARGEFAMAQSLVGASAPDATGTDLIVIDPTTGTHAFYMRISHDTAQNREFHQMTSLPGCKLAATLYRDNGQALGSQYVAIDPLNSSYSIMNFGAPVGTLYAEGMEYSPRHGAILMAFGALNNFGTNRLALINPADATVISSTSTLAGVSDMDYIVSTATDDVVIDFNATSAAGRVKHLTTLMPTPTLATFASPPSLTNYWDAARHPATNEIIFTDTNGTRLVRLVGNAYVNGATLADGVSIRGIAWGFLPPKSNSPAYAGVCPGGAATIEARAVGTPPFTYKWRKGGVDIDSVANPSALAATLSLGAASPQTEGDYSCVISNDCGQHTTPVVPFILCRADFNCDGGVDDTDFIDFVIAYNILDCADPTMTAGCPADLNTDALVDDGDFTVFVQAYNRLLCGA
ncbi:MAG: immunoglobulin domain-containing protein [Phycisphaerales bacterium]